MTELERRALLPDGLRDMLPPTAGFEADVIERLVGHFASHGYARVKAPLVEFEEGLLSGAGAAANLALHLKNDTVETLSLLLTPWPEGPPFDSRQFDPAVLWFDVQHEVLRRKLGRELTERLYPDARTLLGR